MFTGIIEDVGTLQALTRVGSGARATIRTKLADPSTNALGDSIAVDGCCLTATRISDGSFDADLSAETLARTTLGALKAGSRVNLERALAAGGRMGGHIVQGHVDSVGSVVEVRQDGESRILTFRTGPELRPFLAEKGSVAVDGVSLTVNRVDEAGFEVTLVPFTLSHTKFADLKKGAAVNLEADVVAKYVLRGLEAVLGKTLPGGKTLTLDTLKEHGLA